LAAAAACAFSTAAVVIRLASDLSPFEITSYRMLLAGLLVGGTARVVHQPLRLEPGDLRRLAPIGLITGVHFLAFIAALSYTSIAHALTVTYTAPALTALVAWRLLREPMPLRRWGGIALAVAGTGTLAGFEPHLTGRILFGDALALVSALAFAFYSTLGRRERARFPLLTYAGWIYFLAGLATLPFALAAGTHGFTPAAVAAVVYLAAVPLAGGHTLYNAALRRMHPAAVNIIASLEVIGGILLAWLILGEAPGAHTLVGAALTLLGVGLVVM
jgi:drug/metabolite transporter (DMT)-like permease